MKNGEGIYYYLDGSYYEGKWKEDKCHGKGFEYYNDNSHY